MGDRTKGESANEMLSRVRIEADCVVQRCPISLENMSLKTLKYHSATLTKCLNRWSSMANNYSKAELSGASTTNKDAVFDLLTQIRNKVQEVDETIKLLNEYKNND